MVVRLFIKIVLPSRLFVKGVVKACPLGGGGTQVKLLGAEMDKFLSAALLEKFVYFLCGLKGHVGSRNKMEVGIIALCGLFKKRQPRFRFRCIRPKPCRGDR